MRFFYAARSLAYDLVPMGVTDQFLVSQVSARKATARKYTNSMRVLLGHKSENESSYDEGATPPQSSSNTS